MDDELQMKLATVDGRNPERRPRSSWLSIFDRRLAAMEVRDFPNQCEAQAGAFPRGPRAVK